MKSNTRYPLLLLPLCAGALWYAGAAVVAQDDHDHGHTTATQPATRDAPGHDHAHDEHEDHDDHDLHDEHDEHARDDHDHDHDLDAGAHADEVTLTADAIQRYGIRVQRVGRQALSPTFVAPGRVTFNAEAMAHVGSALTGRIVELKARLGDVVRKGDELLVIESPELAEAQSDFLQKRTAVSVAESAVEPARLAYERARALHEKNEGIALGEVQRREAEHKAAEGALATARAARVAAENKLHVLGIDQDAVTALVQSGEVNPRMAVRAPIGGRVIEREVTLGELVNPERDALLVLADMETLWVVADVPEARLAGVAEGARADVQIAALPGKSFTGAITYIASALNPDTRTAGVRVEVPNPQGALRPGMFARVELPAAAAAAGDAPGSGEAVLVVPEEAVQTIDGQPSVFVPVEGEPNTFAVRAVKVGNPVDGVVPVLAGLEEGQRVVAGNTFILKADLGKSGASHGH